MGYSHRHPHSSVLEATQVDAAQCVLVKCGGMWRAVARLGYKPPP